MWLSAILLSCGYQVAGLPLQLNPEWKTIYIPPWKNYTGEKAVGELLAYELRKKIAQDGFLTPVYSSGSADLILRGKVLRVYVEPVAYATFLQTKTRNIHFEGSFTLIEAKTGKTIFQKQQVSYFESYRVTEASEALLDPGREEALRLLVKDLTEFIMQELFAR